jgi:hypothetical protein
MHDGRNRMMAMRGHRATPGGIFNVRSVPGNGYGCVNSEREIIPAIRHLQPLMLLYFATLILMNGSDDFSRHCCAKHD